MIERLKPFREQLAATAATLHGRRLITVAIYGSWARGTATPVSDIDVLVVARDLPPSRRKRVAQFEAVERATEESRGRLWDGQHTAELSPLIKTPDEVLAGSPLFLDMTEWCDIVTDRGHFFAEYLGRLRDRLGELGSRRCPAKGGYYWEYKPGALPGEVIHL